MKETFVLILFLFLALFLPAQSDTLQTEKNIDEMTWEELNAKASGHFEKGEFTLAVAVVTKIIEVAKRDFGEEHKLVGDWLNNLAILYTELGEYEKSIEISLQALKILEKSLGKENLDYCNTLSTLAYSYSSAEQFDKARTLFLESLEILEKIYGREHQHFIHALSGLGVLYSTMGQYEEALPLYLEVIQSTEAKFGKKDFRYGSRLKNLSSLYQKMGQYDKALPLGLKALESLEQSLGQSHPLYNKSLASLAHIYAEIGLYNKALPLMITFLENTESSFGKAHHEYGNALDHIAGLYESMGQYEKALPLYLESLDNTEKSLGKEHSWYGTRLNNLAYLYLKMGHFDTALPLYLEALDNTEKSLGKEHSWYGTRLNNLAYLYLRMGQFDAALPLYLEALDNTEKSLGKEHSWYGIRLNNLANLYESKDSFSMAIKFFKLNNQHLIDRINNTFDQFSQTEQFSLLSGIIRNFETYPSFLIRHPETKVLSKLCFEYNILLKDLLLGKRKQLLRRLRHSTDITVKSKYDDWENIRKTLAVQYSQPLSKRILTFDSLVSQGNKLESELARLSNPFREAREIVNWNEVQKELKDDEALVEFTHFRYFENPQWTDSTFYAAMVLRPGYESPKFIPLFEEQQLEELLMDISNPKEGFLAQLYNSRGVNPRKKKSNTPSLYTLIWEPLDSLLKGVERVYYSPSGLLHRIAFPAMPFGKEEFLADHYHLHYLSSTQQLAFQSKQKSFTPSEIILYGGIQYNFDSTAMASGNLAFEKQGDVLNLNDYSIIERSNQEINWQYLPGTEQELDKVKDLFRDRNITTTSYSGYYATEESFKAIGTSIPSPSILHVATHGFFFPDLKKDKKDLDLIGSGFRFADNSLIRSGLILAGANQAWQGGPVPKGVEDGILTAYEISSMNLSNTKLVVLSACETGLGDIKGSEGVFGLQRAFKMAGVENIIMSLWQVPDEQTGELMEKFYTNWLNGMGIREAFNVAQQNMRMQYKDPYYWAGFVLIE